MQDWIELDSLHVVSDLHLGGRPGFQIFGSTSELAWLIDEIRNRPQPGTHGLLINGDFVDFLAEEPGLCFDADGAVGKLDRIWQRFAPVFEALQRLVATANRALVVNLGNHDLELALPWVRAHLVKRLAGTDEAARARIVMIVDGTGMRARVAGASVVAVHGNEVDSWNVADYERLRRIGRDRQCGLPAQAWTPNAGTQMVIEVMNDIKRQYPFVDLLKPENDAVLPILAALNPRLHRKLFELGAVAGRRGWDIARMWTGFLDGDSSASGADTSRAPSPAFSELARSAAAPDGEALLAEAESAWRRGVLPITLVRDMQGQRLDLRGLARGALSHGPSREGLRKALAPLDRDASFDPGARDDTFDDIDAAIGPGIHLVLAGHTHLERSLPRRRGRGHYYNSGTWARLIRIEPGVREDPVEFEKLFDLFAGGSMDDLDRARVTAAGVPRDLVIRRNTVVVIEPHADARSRVRAGLRHVTPSVRGRPPGLEEINDTIWLGG